MEFALVGNSTLRSAIQQNLVSFPSQVPSFMKRGDLQERIVQLYFVRGWQLQSICKRYGLGKSTVRKLLSDWKIRAVAGGYIQEIDPEAFAILAGEPEADRQEGIEQLEPASQALGLDSLWNTAPLAHIEYVRPAAST